jgi:hypothetical protein
MDPVVHRIQGEEIYLWADPCGVIMIKTVNPYGDPVELTYEGAAELIAVLQRMIDEDSN